MKKFKRALLRPFYAIYWLVFQIKEFFNIESRFEVRIIKDTYGDGIEKIGLISFNDWLNKHGFWKLTNWLENFKVIVPKNYSELIKKYPFPKMSEMICKELKEKPNKQFYYYTENKSDK